ncbi:MAG: hypothetical protein JWQ79_3298 [Mucilaginibacter sp.]|jgi:hypothetical protein|nr:hypothetical protein [Mucilaginibacter sp.]
MTMNKLTKHIFVILILCTSYTGFAQVMIERMPPARQRFYSRPPNFDNRVYRQPNYNNNNRGYRMQNPGMRKIQVAKQNFLSRQLALTPEQGERFWPLYTQYQNELFEVRRLKRLNNSTAQANGTEQIRKDLDYEAQLYNIKRHYTDEFLKVLPPEKVSQLDKSERAFNDELIRQVHEQKSSTAPE